MLNCLCITISDVTLSHLRHLSSLDLSNIIDYKDRATLKRVYTIPEIFASLSREWVYLCRIVMDHMCDSDAVLDYLCSYSGTLEELRFHHIRPVPFNTLGE